MLESSAAVSNAAGRAPRVHSFVSFMFEFVKELGIPHIGAEKFADDPILSTIIVCFLKMLSKSRNLWRLNGFLGTAERQVDDEGINLVVQGVGSSLADSVSGCS